MRTLVFSDTHLTTAFDAKQYNFLKKIILASDRVIIAGDLWEGRLIIFDEFIKSPWSSLFPLLKKKKTVYIYGNHDPKRLSDGRTSEFSEIQTEKYRFSSGNKKITVEHGHLYAQKVPMLNAITSSKFLTKWGHTKSEELLVKMFGRNILQVLYKRYNNKIKNRVDSGKEILITGHTHAAEIDLKNNFINTGIIRHGLGQYIVIDNQKISLREEWYDKPQ